MGACDGVSGFGEVGFVEDGKFRSGVKLNTFSGGAPLNWRRSET